QELMDPKVDFVFKKIFGSEDNTNILVAFLNAIFETKGTEKEIVKVKIENAEINKTWDEDKLTRLDIKATSNENTKINIEIQLKNQYNMKRRTLFYWAKLYTSQLKSGNKYRELNKTVTINILNFNYLEDMEDYHNSFLLKEKDTNQVLTELEEIHFIELPKFDGSKYHEVEDIDEDLIPWLLFLKNPESEVVEMIEEKVAELKEAAESLEVLSHDEETREFYEARQKAIHDHISNLEETRREERRKIAKNLLDVLDIETISNKTGLDVKEVKKIKNKMT
ncbi:MAG: Rpn family recombination-promoting nuclease/putative transposase, partial [Fusobacteriota bacterium]